MHLCQRSRQSARLLSFRTKRRRLYAVPSNCGLSMLPAAMVGLVVGIPAGCGLPAKLLTVTMLTFREAHTQLASLAEETAQIRAQFAARDAADQAQLETRADQAQGIVRVLEMQDDIVFGLFDSYQDDAYGPRVDRIAEQQLIAMEYQLMALQALGLQNRQIADLLLLSYLDAPGGRVR